jgi:hypothetical protein
MSIKLDWQTDGRGAAPIEHRDDPAERRRRATAARRFVLFMIGVIALAGIVVGGVVLRLRETEVLIEQGLRIVVESEVAALRLGDRAAFMRAQWRSQDDPSVTAAWVSVQETTFQSYERLKLTRDVNLTGRILDVTIDGHNARVQIEEIIDGVPYARVWFYWRFEQGWRHVPPAYGFWGTAQVIHDPEGRYSISFSTVDTSVAVAMAEALESWFERLCAIFPCLGMPAARIEILADDELAIGWDVTDPWLLRLPSPYMIRARLDQPFDPDLRRITARALAERWTSLISVRPNTDAAWLRTAIGNYLVEQLSGQATGAYLITSLVESYGERVLTRLVASLNAETRISILAELLDEPLEALRLDWRDYLEAVLAREGMNGVDVISVAREALADGRPALRARVAGAAATEIEVQFSLFDGAWRRTG